MKISWAGPQTANEANGEDTDHNSDHDSDEEDDDESIKFSDDKDEEVEEEQIDHGFSDETNNEDFSIDVEPIEDVPLPPEEQSLSLTCSWTGFKIVGDNIDKNLRRSYQRCDRQTISLHYFHSCAIRDRIDFSGLSDVPSSHAIIDPTTILPTTADLDAIEEEFQVLVSR